MKREKKNKTEALLEMLAMLAQKHNINPKQLEAMLESEKYHAAAPSIDLSDHVKEGKVVFGALDSTRLNSKWMRPDIYRSLYARFEQEGVAYVFHCGDMTDGYMRYKTHVNDVIYVDYSQMLEELFINSKRPEAYPEIGVKTYFLGGNYDKTFFKRKNEQKEMTNVCADIARVRPNLVFAGYNGATIKIAPKTTVQLSHPLPGIGSKKPYTISYPVQKRVQAFGKGQKTDILISGYFQKRFEFKFQGVETQMIGSCISQTPIDAEKENPAPALGGVIFEVYFNKDGSFKELATTDVPFYD